MQPTLGMRYETPQQLKLALANYGVANGYQLWYMKNDWREVLVYCGRNVKEGRCAGKKRTVTRAKQLALFDNEGGLIEHYGKLYQYRQALLESNPGSTCRLDVDESAKENYETAMGRDANNQMYPIAWAVVRVENADNWGWFLHLLHDDLSLNDGNGITIISDSHKGLIDAVNDWFPEAEYRKCTRHIYANFKKKYNSERTPNSWSKKGVLEMDRRCAAFENGISKSFNRAILIPRHKPIITMLEEIRLCIMQRLAAMNKVAFSLEDRITHYLERENGTVFQCIQSLKLGEEDHSYGVNTPTQVMSNAEVGTNTWNGCNDEANGSGMETSGGGTRDSGTSSRGGGTSSRGRGRGRRGGGTTSSGDRRGGGRGSRGVELSVSRDEEAFRECMQEQAREQAKIDVEQERLDKERREEQEREEMNDYFDPANWREDSMEEATF
ncbi:calcium/proton exchanger [Tanacetum coccineum]